MAPEPTNCGQGCGAPLGPRILWRGVGCSGLKLLGPSGRKTLWAEVPVYPGPAQQPQVCPGVPSPPLAPPSQGSQSCHTSPGLSSYWSFWHNEACLRGWPSWQELPLGSSDRGPLPWAQTHGCFSFLLLCFLTQSEFQK